MQLTDKRGRKFTAFAWSIVAYFVVVIGVCVQAAFAPDLEVGTLLAAAGIVTGAAAVYTGGNAFQAHADARVTEATGEVPFEEPADTTPLDEEPDPDSL